MEAIVEMLYRCAGPLMLVAALTVWMGLYSATTEWIESQKKDYTEDSALALSAPESKDRVVTYGELVGRLAEEPSVNTMVSVPSLKLQIFVKVFTNTAVVLVMEDGHQVIRRDSLREDVEVPISVLPDKSYRTVESYDSAGALKSITYIEMED